MPTGEKHSEDGGRYSNGMQFQQPRIVFWSYAATITPPDHQEVNQNRFRR
jgi:hypothetical protein